MDYLNKIIKSTAWIFLGLIISKILGYAFRIVVARIGVEEYGLYNLGFIVFNIFTLIGSAGLMTGIVRYVAYYRETRNHEEIRNIILSSIKLSLPLCIILAIMLFLLAPKIAINIFHNSQLILVLRFFSFLIPLYVLSDIFLSTMDGFKQVKYRVIITHIIEFFIRLIITLILVLLGFGLIAALSGYAIAVIFTFILSAYCLYKLFPFNWNKSAFNYQLILFSWPLFLSKILAVFLTWTDTIMLGIMLSVQSVAIFNVAAPTAVLMTAVSAGFLSIFLPIITEYSAKKKNITPIYTTVTKWIFLVNLPIALILFFFSSEIIMLLYGEQYASAYAALSILSPAYFINSVFKTSTDVIKMAGKTKIIFFVNLFIALMNVLLNYFLIPLWQITGAAIATSLCLITVSLFWFYFSYTITKTIPMNRTYVYACLGGIIPFFLSYALLNMFYPTEVPVLILVSLLIGSLIIYLLSVMLFVFDKTDWTIINAIKTRIYCINQ